MNPADTMSLALLQRAQDGFETIRDSARKSFLADGWPTRRNEAYKYTDLAFLARDDWPRAPRPKARPELPAALGARSLWVDGYLENATDRRGMLQSLRACAKSPAPQLKALLGRLAGADDPIVALNTALFDHGAWIRLPEGAAPAEIIELAFAAGARPTAAYGHSRLALELGRNSRLVLIERHLGNATTLATRVAEISLGTGAELFHIRINETGSDTRLLGHSAVNIDAGARYRYLGLDFGGRLAREALRVTLHGREAATELAGLAVLDGRRHADADVEVVHAAPNTRSRQQFRAVLDGHGRSVYTGRVKVLPGARKTDAAQQSANLLLSPHAEADSRPQLEIYADDVACSHGSATGAIDPEALFYLRSRGLSTDSARHLIAYGFAARTLAALPEGGSIGRAVAVLLAARLDAPAEVREWL